MGLLFSPPVINGNDLAEIHPYFISVIWFKLMVKYQLNKIRVI